MAKTTTSVTIDSELMDIARARDINVSNILNESLKALLNAEGDSFFLKKKEIEEQIEEEQNNLIKSKAKIETLNKSLENLKKLEELENNRKLNPEEYFFFKECKSKLEQNPGYMEGMIKRYKNEFLKDINEKIFLEKLDQVGEYDYKKEKEVAKNVCETKTNE